MIRIEQNIFEHLNFLISSFGTFTFYTILFLSFIGISYSFFIKKLKLEEIISRYELILISSIPIPFIFYFTSVQTSFRKISLAMVLISIVLLIIGFRNLKPIKNINSVIFICVIILVFSHGKLILEDKEHSFFKNSNPTIFTGTTFPVPINIDPNPHNTVIDKIDHLRKKYQVNYIALPIDENSNPVDPFLLSIMAGQKGFIANYPYTSSFKKDLDFLKNFDAALIINPEGKMIKSFV